jgi:hypothetical protein
MLLKLLSSTNPGGGKLNIRAEFTITSVTLKIA